MKRKFYRWSMVVLMLIGIMSVFSITALADETNNSTSTQVTNASRSGDTGSGMMLAAGDINICINSCTIARDRCYRSCGNIVNDQWVVAATIVEKKQVYVMTLVGNEVLCINYSVGCHDGVHFRGMSRLRR
jgi:hypothetical protein